MPGLQNYFFSADLQGMAQLPASLTAGDRIALVAPARFCTPDQADAVASWISHNGFTPHIPEGLFARDGQLAGDDTLRAKLLNGVLNDSTIKAVICMRGGYGSARLLPKLELPTPDRAPWLCGFSDITALHAAMNAHGVASLHSPVGTTFTAAPATVHDAFFNLLTGRTAFSLDQEVTVLRGGNVRGRIIGGNLSVLYSLLGTPWFPNVDGAILILEDLDEMLYHLDRMLNSFKLAGIFDRVAALVVGGMTEMRDNTRAYGFSSDNPYGYSTEEILAHYLGQLEIPVCTGASFGHIDANFPVLLGAEAELHLAGIGAQKKALMRLSAVAPQGFEP